MGLTIYSRNNKNPKDLCCSYRGLFSLRYELLKKIDNQIAKCYFEIFQCATTSFIPSEKEKLEENSKKFSKLADSLVKEKKATDGFFRFICANDIAGKLTAKKTEELFETIKGIDLDLQFGYIAQKDCATFNDFKELVKWCVDNKQGLKWD